MGLADERFVRWLREDLESSLRGVLTYRDGGEFQVHYLRTDLKDDDEWRHLVREEIPDLVSLARREHAANALSLFGDYGGTVRVFSNAILIQLPVSETAGYGVSVDPEVAPRLVGFVDAATTHLDSEDG